MSDDPKRDALYDRFYDLNSALKKVQGEILADLLTQQEYVWVVTSTGSWGTSAFLYNERHPHPLTNYLVKVGPIYWRALHFWVAERANSSFKQVWVKGSMETMLGVGLKLTLDTKVIGLLQEALLMKVYEMEECPICGPHGTWVPPMKYAIEPKGEEDG